VWRKGIRDFIGIVRRRKGIREKGIGWSLQGWGGLDWARWSGLAISILDMLLGKAML
jgi:hypothetical protein